MFKPAGFKEFLYNFAVRKLRQGSFLHNFLRALWRTLKYFEIEWKSSKNVQGLFSSGNNVFSEESSLAISNYFGEVVEPVRSSFNKTCQEILHDAVVSVDIVITLYNRADLLETLVPQLEKEISAIPKGVRIQCYVYDDASDPRSSLRAKEICSQYGVGVIRHHKNVGVVKNLNRAFANSKSQVFLILNSDVLVESGFLSATLAPILVDEKVALVTAPNLKLFGDRSIEARKPWNELANILSANDCEYLDACTAISYALAIRRSAISKKPLLDEGYGRGYGEESDLHYRVVSDGWRSVWTLNTVVSHYGGASFGDVENVNEEKILGHKRFMEKWGSRYVAEIDSHEAILKEAISNVKMRKKLQGSESTTWILTPDINMQIGGQRTIESLTKNLLRDGMKVKLINFRGSDIENFMDLLYTSELNQFWKKHKFNDRVIINGGEMLHYIFSNLVHLRTSNLIYFFQGPDYLIDPSKVRVFLDMKKFICEVIVNSSVMYKTALELGFDKNQISEIDLDTKDIYFSKKGKELTIRDYDVLMLLRKEEGKGAYIAEFIANYLGVRGYKVMIFGHSETIANRRLDLSVETNFDTSRANLLNLLRNSKIYIDTSQFEGLGLSPREAADLGCAVYLFNNVGGTTQLLKYPKHFDVISDSIFGLLSAMKNVEQKIVQLRDREVLCNSCDYCKRFEVAKVRQ